MEEQKHLVEEKQKEILDSISYAKRLQEAILPPTDFVNANLKNNTNFYHVLYMRHNVHLLMNLNVQHQHTANIGNYQVLNNVD